MCFAHCGEANFEQTFCGDTSSPLRLALQTSERSTAKVIRAAPCTFCTVRFYLAHTVGGSKTSSTPATQPVTPRKRSSTHCAARLLSAPAFRLPKLALYLLTFFRGAAGFKSARRARAGGETPPPLEKWEVLLGIRLLGTTFGSGLSNHQDATAQTHLVEQTYCRVPTPLRSTSHFSDCKRRLQEGAPRQALGERKRVGAEGAAATRRM